MSGDSNKWLNTGSRQIKSGRKINLTPEQYEVCRRKGTELPFSGEYVNSKEKGIYMCVCCGNGLFSSDDKFDSGTDWPSFTQSIRDENVEKQSDLSYGMYITEVMCSKCGAHLGHVFNDGPILQAIDTA
jgi:peptide-methionine (R)-S-oxide reductase